jgi:hypothetical protein
MTDPLTDSPVAVLERRLRDIADRIASRGIHERRLRVELADAHREIADLTAAHRATSGLLAMYAALQARQTAPVDKPASTSRKTTSSKGVTE